MCIDCHFLVQAVEFNLCIAYFWVMVTSITVYSLRVFSYKYLQT